MPSPILHAAAGYLAFRYLKAIVPVADTAGRQRVHPLLVATVGVSLLPDLDFLPGLVVGDPGRYHNGPATSLLAGPFVSLIAALLAWSWQRCGFTHWFLATLLCYESHLVMDYCTVGRGIQALWPLSGRRFRSPLMFFPGVQRGRGWGVLARAAGFELSLLAVMAVAGSALRRWTDR